MPATAIPSAPAVDFAALTEAEQYALVYPVRARRIRAENLPARPDYGPPEPAIARELVHGTSLILRALDDPPDDGAAGSGSSPAQRRSTSSETVRLVWD
jgi:hypothetical protein